MFMNIFATRNKTMENILLKIAGLVLLVVWIMCLFPFLSNLQLLRDLKMLDLKEFVAGLHELYFRRHGVAYDKIVDPAGPSFFFYLVKDIIVSSVALIGLVTVFYFILIPSTITREILNTTQPQTTLKP
jgi:hypothetical protein